MIPTHRFHIRINSGDKWVESSLVSKVKEKQDQDPILLDLKENVQKQRLLAFELGGDDGLKH